MKDVDKKGIKIAVAERSAYDLWLTENIKNADLIRAKSIDESFRIFQENKYEVLAGLRPKLVDEIKKTTDCFIFNEPFTYINQCIGCKPGNLEAENFGGKISSIQNTVCRDSFVGISNSNNFSFIALIN